MLKVRSSSTSAKRQFNMDDCGFIAISAIVLLSANVVAGGFAEERWLNVATQCAEFLNEEDAALIVSTQPDYGRLKNYSLCLYKGIGYYHDGAFDLEYAKKFVEDLYPDRKVSTVIHRWNVKHMLQANALQGEDSDRTYLFWDHGNDEEYLRLMELLSETSPDFSKISEELLLPLVSEE